MVISKAQGHGSRPFLKFDTGFGDLSVYNPQGCSALQLRYTQQRIGLASGQVCHFRPRTEMFLILFEMKDTIMQLYSINGLKMGGHYANCHPRTHSIE